MTCEPFEPASQNNVTLRATYFTIWAICMEADIEFRPYSVSDIPCIRSNWANSFYKGNQNHKLIPPHDFHMAHRSIIDRFFMRPTATIIVCSRAGDPDLILGWIALEILPSATLIHYIYVKFTYKGQKLTRELLSKIPKDKPIIATHMTEKASRIMGAKHENFKEWNFIPHMA